MLLCVCVCVLNMLRIHFEPNVLCVSRVSDGMHKVERVQIVRKSVCECAVESVWRTKLNYTYHTCRQRSQIRNEINTFLLDGDIQICEQFPSVNGHMGRINTTTTHPTRWSFSPRSDACPLTRKHSLQFTRFTCTYFIWLRLPNNVDHVERWGASASHTHRHNTDNFDARKSLTYTHKHMVYNGFVLTIAGKMFNSRCTGMALKST